MKKNMQIPTLFLLLMITELLTLFYYPFLKYFLNSESNRFGIATGFLLLVLHLFLIILLLAVFYRKTNEDAKQEASLKMQQMEIEQIRMELENEKNLKRLKEKLKSETINFSDDHRKIIQDFLEKEQPALFSRFSAHPLLNSLLYYKSQIMKTKGIACDIDAFSIPASLELEPYALLSVLANLIDNAIEAEENVKEKEIRISIMIKANYLISSVQNRIAKPVELKEGKSSKTNMQEHGLGLSIIKETCKQKEGSFTAFSKDGWLYAVATMKTGDIHESVGNS